MKKKVGVIAILIAVMVMGSAVAQIKSLDRDNAYYIYLKGINTKLSEEEYLNWVQVFEYETYKKYKNDEFEWDEQFGLLKQKFDKAIAGADMDSTYTIVTDVMFGDYDFTSEGFPVEIEESSFFPLRLPSYYYNAGYNSIFKKEIAFKLYNFNKYNFISMPKENARTFLQKRKDRSGYVDRKIKLQITYKIAKFDSKEYKSFSDLALSNGYLPIVGNIEKIEVFDAANSRDVKKIGELIIK